MSVQHTAATVEVIDGIQHRIHTPAVTTPCDSPPAAAVATNNQVDVMPFLGRADWGGPFNAYCASAGWLCCSSLQPMPCPLSFLLRYRCHALLSHVARPMLCPPQFHAARPMAWLPQFSVALPVPEQTRRWPTLARSLCATLHGSRTRGWWCQSWCPPTAPPPSQPLTGTPRTSMRSCG